MALVHILDKQSDEIIGTLNSTKAEYWEAKRKDTLDNANTFDFVANGKLEKSTLLEKRNRLLIMDEDGFFREYIISYAEQYKRSEKMVKSNASFVDLAKAKTIEPQTLQGATPSTAADTALSGTEWQKGIIEFNGIRTITIDDYTDPLSLLKLIASTFDLELRYRVEVDGNKVTGRYVDLVQQYAAFEGKEIVFGKDLIDIKRKEDGSQIVTALLGLGPKKEDGTRLTVFVEDKDALARWGRNGRHLVQPYEPESSNQDMTLDELQTLTANELQKRIDSIVSYEGNAASIEHIFGRSHEKIRVGQTVRIKDDGYQPPLYLEARIQENEVDQITKKVLNFKIGNFTAFKKSDLEAQIKTLKDVLSQKATVVALQQAQEQAAADAQTKANAAQQAAIDTASADATTKADNAVSTAATDATNKANIAEDNAKSYTDDQLLNYVQAVTYNQDISDLQSQIDGNITSWFYDYEPSLSNAPTNAWVSTADKNNHLGDLFYNTTNGYSYRFAVVNGTYQWILLKDSDVQKALSDAATAQDTADNKRRVFVNQPIPPYDVGDLWTQGTSGDLMRCQTAKANGQAYSASDWIKASKYTDDTRAVQAEDNAKSYTDQTVAPIESRLSTAETNITQNSNQIALKANSTDVYVKTEVDTKVDAKANQSDLDTTNSNVSNLTTRVTNNESELSVQADEIASKVSQTDFDNLRIGGRNLVKGFPTNEKLNLSTIGYYVEQYLNIPLEPNVEYTFSYDFEVISGTLANLYAGVGAGNLNAYNYDFIGWDNNPITNKVHHFITGDIIDYPYFQWRPFIDKANVGEYKEINFWNIKLEKGNRPTDWTPAPEDTQSQIDGLGGRLTTAESNITQNANQIQSKVSQSTYDTDIPDLQNRMSSAESSITQNADSINLKVDKDGVISSINVSQETIQLLADKIALDGYVEAKHIKSLFGLNVNDQFVVDANGNVTLSGDLSGATGTFEGDLIAGKVTIGPETPNIGPYSDGSIGVSFKMPVRVSDGVYQWGTPMDVKLFNNGVSFEGPQTIDFAPSLAFTINSKNPLVVDSHNLTAPSSNGYYIRFTNGLQICWMAQSVTDQSIANAYGSLYQGTRTWTFPATFASRPSVTCSEFHWGTSASWAGTSGAASTTAAVLRGWDVASRPTGTNCDISAMAIGMWK